MGRAVHCFCRLPAVRVLLSAVVLAAGSPNAALADVIVSTSTSGPVYGDGGTFTVTAAGSISSGGEGIIASSTNGITTLENAGSITGATNAFSSSA